MNNDVERNCMGNPLIANIKEGLDRNGFYYMPRLLASENARGDFLALAHSLGEPVVPSGCKTTWPVIETQPALNASIKRPFDRRESIGWHNDFTTHRWRPRWTLMWIVRPDPVGGLFGAWNIALSAGHHF